MSGYSQHHNFCIEEVITFENDNANQWTFFLLGIDNKDKEVPKDTKRELRRKEIDSVHLPCHMLNGRTKITKPVNSDGTMSKNEVELSQFY